MLRSASSLRLLPLLFSIAWMPACGNEAVTTPADGPPTGVTASTQPVPAPAPIREFVQKGLDWLVAAQHEDGGWGAGSHARQQIRDPKAVQTDPATTAFVALALLRAGGAPDAEPYGQALTRAAAYLATSVEKAPHDSKMITTLTSTQPQTKLGPHIDTAIATQYLARVLPMLAEGSDLHNRVNAALDTCIGKLQDTQHKDGTWGKRGGWAPVLQASMGGNALELAEQAGKPIDLNALKRARDYQQANVDGVSGRAAADEAAGVELYSFAGAGRAFGSRAGRARELVADAKARKELPMDAPVTAETIGIAGASSEEAEILADAVQKVQSRNSRLGDENLLKGFGNNGGEEYLSYMLTSESLVVEGGKPWEDWNEKMHTRLAKVQSADGSWTGHHCITSPVFCTAAVVQTLMVDRDIALLRAATSSKEAAAATK